MENTLITINNETDINKIDLHFSNVELSEDQIIESIQVIGDHKERSKMLYFRSLFKGVQVLIDMIDYDGKITQFFKSDYYRDKFNIQDINKEWRSHYNHYKIGSIADRLMSSDLFKIGSAKLNTITSLFDKINNDDILKSIDFKELYTISQNHSNETDFKIYASQYILTSCKRMLPSLDSLPADQVNNVSKLKTKIDSLLWDNDLSIQKREAVNSRQIEDEKNAKNEPDEKSGESVQNVKIEKNEPDVQNVKIEESVSDEQSSESVEDPKNEQSVEIVSDEQIEESTEYIFSEKDLINVLNEYSASGMTSEEFVASLNKA